MTKRRFCKFCKKNRQTTNFKDKIYICEPCLRTRGRKLMLIINEVILKAKELGRKEGRDDLKAIKLAYFIIGIIVGLMIYGAIVKWF